MSDYQSLCRTLNQVLRPPVEAVNKLIDKLYDENKELREELERVQPTDSEGEPLDIADTVHMLRSEYDGDHEWDDVVTELVITKWGGDRWIVRGAKGEAWACDCTRTANDVDMYEASDGAEPVENPLLFETENAELRLCLADDAEMARLIMAENAKLRELVRDMWRFTGAACKKYPKLFDPTAPGGQMVQFNPIDTFEQRMRELGIEV